MTEIPQPDHTKKLKDPYGDLDPHALAVALAAGTTEIRRPDGTMETWRIDHFKPLAKRIVMCMRACSGVPDDRLAKCGKIEVRDLLLLADSGILDQGIGKL